MDKKVTIVEDNRFIAELLSVMLSKAGYCASIVLDSKEALQKIRKIRPKLVLMDIMMPELPGNRLYSLMKKDEKLKNTPVVILTAKYDALEQYPELRGAEGFVTKPFVRKNLLDTIRAALSQNPGRVTATG